MCDPYPYDTCPECGYTANDDYPIDDDYELINDDHWNFIKEGER